MDRKFGGLCPFGGGWAGSPSNTMWPGPRPTFLLSFILIHPTVWPQYTNVTDRQTGQTGQQSDSIGWTVLQTVAQKWGQNKLMAVLHVLFKSFLLMVCSVSLFVVLLWDMEIATLHSSPRSNSVVKTQKLCCAYCVCQYYAVWLQHM